MNKKPKGDICWTLPKKKKPFAYSTRATNDLIVVLAQEYETVTQVYEAIHYDNEAKSILQHIIDAGYGNRRLREFVY